MKVLVTGAARGLGRALVERVLDRGGTVVAVDRDAAGLAELDYLYPKHVTTRRVDLSDGEAVAALSGELARFFRFDLVVLNAGISATGPFESVPGEAYRRLVRVNVAAPLVMASTLTRDGAMNRQSTIVFVSSLSHAVGYPGAAVYAATKDAVAAYARSVRRPFGKRGVRVAAVYPGPIRTDHAERHAPAGARADRRMAPEAVAKAILKGVRKRRRSIYPGLAANAAGLTGKTFPGAMTRLMRRAIFEKLDRSVW